MSKHITYKILTLISREGLHQGGICVLFVSWFGTILYHTLCHSAIPPFRHSAILPFRHSAIPPFRNSTIPPFSHSAIPPFRHSAIPPFCHSAIPLQYAITPCMYHRKCQDKRSCYPEVYGVTDMCLLRKPNRYSIWIVCRLRQNYVRLSWRFFQHRFFWFRQADGTIHWEYM